ncbi:hypothetical protein HDN1F_22780 [gamma proteobacterium HdN1]|nr:hypothetical protein HDN1F_22780 [gamma proteobacterium HdN1]
MGFLTKRTSVALTVLMVTLPWAPATVQASSMATPVGLWQTVDDNSGEATAEVRISETAAGELSGVIERRLDAAAKPEDRCVKCRGDRKDQLVLGMEIIREAKKVEGESIWAGGQILDPEDGRDYKLRLTPVADGQKLEVRGSFGPFWRTQTWVRVQ